MNFTDWKKELEECGYVVLEDTITTQRGDVLAGKDPYGGYYISDSRIQDIISKAPSKVETVKKAVKKAVTPRKKSTK